MSDPGNEAPFLTNIGLFITYRCQVACPHCVVRAGPQRKEEMALADALSWMDQAAAYRGGRILAACFTGGEPFVELDRLGRLVRLAESRGLVPTAVTNAHWATSRERALEVLSSVSGLRALAVSADTHHQREIPFERVTHAVAAAQALNVAVSVTVCTESESDPMHLDLLARLEPLVGRDGITTVVTFPAGRALTSLRSPRYDLVSTPPATACPSAATPTIFPDGRVYACVGPIIDVPGGHPFLLGNLREKSLQEILDAAERNVVLHVVRVWGPARLLSLLAELGEGVAPSLPRRFVKNSMCNLCYTLVADATLSQAMAELARDDALAEKTAYARLHYLDESGMLQAFANRLRHTPAGGLMS